MWIDRGLFVAPSDISPHLIEDSDLCVSCGNHAARYSHDPDGPNEPRSEPPKKRAIPNEPIVVKLTIINDPQADRAEAPLGDAVGTSKLGDQPE